MVNEYPRDGSAGVVFCHTPTAVLKNGVEEKSKDRFKRIGTTGQEKITAV